MKDFMVNESMKLKETVQEKITIKEFFEPFEIQWLLAYIYFPCKHIDHPDLFYYISVVILPGRRRSSLK